MQRLFLDSSARTLGQELRALRHAARLSLRQLEWLCELSAPQLCRIESGARRTRQSTLERIAASLVSVRPDLGPAAELARWLTSLAGPALAPESAYAEEIAERRRRQWERKRKEGRRVLSMCSGRNTRCPWAPYGVVESL